MTFSQVVWAIDELVCLICSHVLEYRVLEYNDHDNVHDGLVLDPNSRHTLARGVLYLNRFISRIAIKFLWMELSSINPLCALFPLNYCQCGETKYIYTREGMQEDFDRFGVYSKHVRYLRIEGRILPDELMKDYVRLFPDRPFLPRVQSISMRTSFVPWLRFLLRSSTPAENQPSAPASTLKHLYIYSTLEAHDVLREEGEGFAHDFVAFQHSNVKLGGGLDFSEDPIVLPTVDSPAHRLRHLEVSHFLADLPDLFGRVAKMRALEHLKMVILDSSDSAMWGVEDKKERIQHSLSSLAVEGEWGHLSRTINLCASPSTTAELRTLRLYYYRMTSALAEATVAQVLDLPADIIPPDHLEVLSIGPNTPF